MTYHKEALILAAYRKEADRLRRAKRRVAA